MTALVLDCSIAAAWLFADEADPETDHLLARIKDEGALVPNLWHLEVGNMLLQAEKKGRITASQINVRLALLADLPITTDTETAPRARAAPAPLSPRAGATRAAHTVSMPATIMAPTSTITRPSASAYKTTASNSEPQPRSLITLASRLRTAASRSCAAC